MLRMQNDKLGHERKINETLDRECEKNVLQPSAADKPGF
jgi:hypothetical protein